MANKTTKQSFRHVHPTGLALGITAGIAYTLCAVAVAFWPVQFVRFFNSWFHGIDLSKIMAAAQITIGNFVVGLVGIMVVAYLTGAFYAWMYNKCVRHCQRKGRI